MSSATVRTTWTVLVASILVTLFTSYGDFLVEGALVVDDRQEEEKGKPILFSGVNEFKVKLGGEYSLELQDEKHGLLAYDARLGFITTK